jgi:hypothetical protein
VGERGARPGAGASSRTTPPQTWYYQRSMTSPTAPRLPADWTATQWRGPTRLLDEARAVAVRENVSLAEVFRLALGLFLDAVNAPPIRGRCGRCGRQLDACDCRTVRPAEKVPA